MHRLFDRAGLGFDMYSNTPSPRADEASKRPQIVVATTEDHWIQPTFLDIERHTFTSFEAHMTTMPKLFGRPMEGSTGVDLRAPPCRS